MGCSGRQALSDGTHMLDAMKSDLTVSQMGKWEMPSFNFNSATVVRLVCTPPSKYF